MFKFQGVTDATVQLRNLAGKQTMRSARIFSSRVKHYQLIRLWQVSLYIEIEVSLESRMG